jgi:hypothetical protein
MTRALGPVTESLSSKALFAPFLVDSESNNVGSEDACLTGMQRGTSYRMAFSSSTFITSSDYPKTPNAAMRFLASGAHSFVRLRRDPGHFFAAARLDNARLPLPREPLGACARASEPAMRPSFYRH